MTKMAIQSDLTGWVPIDFAWRTESCDSHLDRIAWAYCGGVSFSEPFFLQTIARLKAEEKSSEIICTNSSVVTNRIEKFCDYQPSGLIFHISRCGSTALANCIKRCGNTQVVSEYWPLTQYHWHRVLKREFLSPMSEPAIDALAIRAATWSLARCRLGTNENLVLKLTSSSLHSLAEIKRIWPNVPRLLVLRHPLEVAVSSLRGGGWMALKQDALRSSCLTGGASSGADGTLIMSDEEYVARVLGTYLDIAAKNLATFDLIIRHEELTNSTVREAAYALGLNPPNGDDINRELAIDSKRGNSSKYQPRPYLWHANFSNELEEQVNNHATPKYNEIIAQIDSHRAAIKAARTKAAINEIN
ncbi:hypothetical protein [Rhizobium ruizarguesonis]|uniref:hypothetical protein n=1 Tax=Rhizobium ruizarguesonis TaxID=2081791 RepID=UPI0010311F48|nr:hypothetical protein [Rhizobium ruizarguesonis]TBE31660.1 hypothetical protein ELH07_02600 [Rhizobium ruizarguesonis]